MSVIVKMMTGVCYSFSIYEGYRIKNLRLELEEQINIGDSERFLFFTNDKEVKNEELVDENTVFNIFVKDPPTIHFEYNNITQKLDVSIDCVSIDIENYRFLNYHGEYQGIFVPNRPLLVRIHQSMNDKGYKEIIRYFHQQWLDEFDNFQKKTWNEDFRETFVSYYKSLLKNNYQYNHEYEDSDNNTKLKQKDIDELFEIKLENHLYAFITHHIPRNDSYKPVEIVKIEIL